MRWKQDGSNANKHPSNGNRNDGGADSEQRAFNSELPPHHVFRRAERDPKWQQHALAAWRWFFGANDRGVVLADLATGRCRDGINPRGVNENCGAESILAFQLSYYSLIGLLRGQQGDSTGERFVSEPQRIAEPTSHT